MNSLRRRPVLLAALFFCSSMLWISCEKPEETLGEELQPNEDLLNTFNSDTSSILAYTLAEDSLRTDALNPALVGAYQDPIFGTHQASHITEVRLSTELPQFIPDSLTLADVTVDSLVLALHYRPLEYAGLPVFQYAGSGSQYFEVFEVLDSLELNTPYYDRSTVQVSTEDLVLPGHNIQQPIFDQDAVVGGDTIEPQLRIQLKHSLANRILEASADSALTSAAFVSLLKGLKISVDPTKSFLSQTGITYFETFDGIAGSTLSMYYSLAGDTAQLSYDFEIRASTAKFNQFTHDYERASPSLQSQVIAGDRAPGLQDLYVQAMGGTKVRIAFPHILDFKELGNVAVNKAELIVPARLNRLDLSKGYFPPNALFLFGLNEEERIFLLSDQLDNAIDGNYNEEEGYYRFLITRHIQQVLSGQRDNVTLEMVTSSAGFSANRVVLNGPEYPSAEAPENNMRLILTYTKY